MLLDKSWKTINGKPMPNILEDIKALLVEDDTEIHVGTDSQQAGKHTEFVSVIVVLKKGKGGRAFYARERTARVKSLRERLLKEVWMSVNTGLELNSHIPETSGLTVHIDANPNLNFRSSDHVKELTAMVVSQGFKTLLKPDSWCASHTADHVVKKTVLKAS